MTVSAPDLITAENTVTAPLDGDGFCDRCGWVRDYKYMRNVRAKFRLNLINGGSVDLCNSHFNQKRQRIEQQQAEGNLFITDLTTDPA